MKLSDRAEEILESLWIASKEENKSSLSLEELGLEKEESTLRELLDRGWVEKNKKGLIQLKEKGIKEAENIVRQHRLAERLMVDVLNLKRGVVDKAACQFEHALCEGVDENVCILLGHPRICPHGKPIPPGRCCLEAKKTAYPVILPLINLNPGQEGKVAYLYTGEKMRIEKLFTLGVLPGIRIKLIQKFPSYVFQIGYSQIAVDKEMAQDIYVRIEDGKEKVKG